jgi:aminoglycoside phosphotransferase family enzyme/predicted kinase
VQIHRAYQLVQVLNGEVTKPPGQKPLCFNSLNFEIFDRIRTRGNSVVIEDQTATLAFLKAQANQGTEERDVTTIQTHISEVVLAGARAFKLKRAVRLPYVNFSTVSQRFDACLKELELNRRTAPSLYRAVRRITQQPNGSLTFDGDGKLVDAVVEMARFDESTLFDRLARRNQISLPLLTELARAIATFHRTAPVSHNKTGAANIASVLDINQKALQTTRSFAPALVSEYTIALNIIFDRNLLLLNKRERDGKIRRCHGDLHLGNICVVDGVPTLFDCIEFDEALATIDILYDLAFLIMDLWHRGLASSANYTLNRYLDVYDERSGLPLMPFFMSLRAAVRAHVTAAQADETVDQRSEDLVGKAIAYLELSRELLNDRPLRLVAIGGYSGTGKSTVAANVAHTIGPPPGARVLSSDRIRKQFCGVSTETTLSEDAYRSDVSEIVYATLMAEAREILASGYAVIVDAVFDRPTERERIKQIAMGAGVLFTGLWLEAPSATLLSRVSARKNDPSDATTEVVKAQLARGCGSMDWRQIEASGELADVTDYTINALDLDLPPHFFFT